MDWASSPTTQMLRFTADNFFVIKYWETFVSWNSSTITCLNLCWYLFNTSKWSRKRMLVWNNKSSKSIAFAAKQRAQYNWYNSPIAGMRARRSSSARMEEPVYCAGPIKRFFALEIRFKTKFTLYTLSSKFFSLISARIRDLESSVS